jgi:hypothetical protein
MCTSGPPEAGRQRRCRRSRSILWGSLTQASAKYASGRVDTGILVECSFYMARKPPIQSPPKRQLGKFAVVADPRRRLNPQSLRSTLYEITELFFGRDLTRAAKSLNVALRTRFNRNLRQGLTEEILYNILCVDKTHIKYAHLEAYARYMDVPVSVILLYSRLRSNQRDARPQDNLSVLNGFSMIVQDALKKYNNSETDLYRLDDLMRWTSLYKSQISAPELFPLIEP